MPKGWKSNVFRTDEEPARYCGFFYDDGAAQTWIDKQTEGTYEISDKGPRKRGES